MQQTLSVTQQGDVAILNLDDGRVNALNPSMMSAIDAALTQASDAGAVVLAGRNGVFSGGLDLKYLPYASSAERIEAIDQFHALMLRIFGFPRPLIAAVSGHALGGGAILALAVEMRYFAEGNSRFSLVEVPLGIPLPGFAMEFAGTAVSGHVLTEMCVHGRVFNPSEALDGGLAAGVVPPERLLETTLEKATALAKLPRDAFASTKVRFRAAALARAQEAIVREGPEFIAAFEAVLDKARR